MSRIRGKDTGIETRLRKALHALGYRYRLHGADLPGKPDVVFPRYRAVILLNGCFWHGHDCGLFRMPKTNPEFWEKKISDNIARDQANLLRLTELGWRSLTVWECSMRGRGHLPFEALVGLAVQWLENGVESSELRGGE